MPVNPDTPQQKSLQDYIEILKRRRALLLVTTIIIAVLSVLVTFSIPATYQSQATILIEDQEVPREFVMSTITSFAAQRIQVISQRVLTADSISRIADKFELYRSVSDNSRLPRTLLAERFRGDTQLELVSADVIDPRSGRATEATIAFTLSFEHGNPLTAQRVTNELVTLFLDANLRARTARATSTRDFLRAEAASLNNELVRLEERLAQFKRKNEGALPELYQFNLSALERATRDIEQTDIRLRELSKRRIEITAELALLNPSAPIMLPSGEMVLSNQDRLRALRSEYRQKKAIYKPTHPSVRALEGEIERLEEELGVGVSSDELAQQLKQERDNLADLRQRFTEDNPLIASTLKLITSLEQQIASSTNDRPQANAPDNPAYVLLDTQRKTVVAEIAALRERRGTLVGNIARIESNIARAPLVEKDYQVLLRDHENASTKYQEVRAMQREATLAENLEQERKGERFLLVEPPNLPESPSRPNRPILLLAGLMCALSFGVAAALVREVFDQAIYGEHQLTQVTSHPPFAVIGYIDNAEDVKQRAIWRTKLVWGGLLVGLLMALFFHNAIQPIDIALYALLNKLGM